MSYRFFFINSRIIAIAFGIVFDVLLGFSHYAHELIDKNVYAFLNIYVHRENATYRSTCQFVSIVYNDKDVWYFRR